MRTPRHARIPSALLVVGLGAGFLAGCDPEDNDTEREYELENFRSGDLFVLEDGTSVAIPEPGVTVEIVDELRYGSSRQRVETRLDGTVVYQPPVFEAPAEEGDDAFRVAGDDCQYDYFNTNIPFSGPYEYHLNFEKKPNQVTLTEFVFGVGAAATSIEHMHNNCGVPDLVNNPTNYVSLTTLAGAPGDGNGQNVIGWSDDLPPPTLARAFIWSSGGVSVEADIGFSTQYEWYGEHDPPYGCTDHYSLRGVATHELGHVWGLGHARGPTQTMYPTTEPCTTAAYSLSPGDIYGFFDLY